MNAVTEVAALTPAAREISGAAWMGKLQIAALVSVFLIGLVYVPHPFHDDQAFFTIGAWEMDHGGVLYRDYWDIKQPGIFLFYLAGGKVLGFNEFGIHGLELLYFTAFGVVLMFSLRNYFESNWATALLVLLTVGLYYGVTGLPHVTLDYLTQVEGLVAFPMFMCAWFACRAAEVPSHRTLFGFLSGLMAAAVLLFKLVFLPIPLCFWMVAWWFSRKKSETFQALLVALIGLLLPLAAVAGYFAVHGALPEFWYANFVWPVRALGKLPLAGPGRLHESIQFFLDGFAPLLALAFIGAWRAFRGKRDPLGISLMLWVLVGMLVILVQRRSWWPHHFLLFVAPLGILATQGIDFLWVQAERISFDRIMAKLVFACILLLLFSPVIYPTAADAMLLAQYRFALTRESRLAFQCRYPGTQYLQSSDYAFLGEPGSLPGPIYVAGSSLFYYLSGRLPAVPQSAGVDDFLPEQWTKIAHDLAVSRPNYVLISAKDKGFFEKFSPETLLMLQHDYNILREDPAGVWYVRRNPLLQIKNQKPFQFRLPSPGCPSRAPELRV
jgi:hypothetical protein